MVVDGRPDLRVLSLGGGVQSTALALMAADGRFGPPPDVAFFADTGWEPPYVYETVAAVKERAGFPVRTVSNGRNLAEDTFQGVAANGNRFIPVPVFIKYPDGKRGMNLRQCTNQYKIDPINKAIRAMLGATEKGQRVPHGTRVEQWMGISTDEILRAKPNRLKYITHRFPLVEEDLSRTDCQEYMTAYHPDVPVGKSACVGCPYHSADAWRTIRREHPAEFRRAVEIDRRLRTPGHNLKAGDCYLHSRRVPLDEAVQSPSVEPGLWDEECEGMCFV